MKSWKSFFEKVLVGLWYCPYIVLLKRALKRGINPATALKNTTSSVLLDFLGVIFDQKFKKINPEDIAPADFLVQSTPFLPKRPPKFCRGTPVPQNWGIFIEILLMENTLWTLPYKIGPKTNSSQRNSFCGQARWPDLKFCAMYICL